MIKRFVVFLPVLVALIFATSVFAQDELPWEAEAGGDSATATYHTYANMVISDPCLLLEFTIGSDVGSTPDEIQPFVNRGKQQWVYPVEEILPGQANGITFTVYVPFDRMRLKVDGHLSETEYFDPTAGKVSDVGLHLWDPEFEANLVLTRFEAMSERCIEILIPEGEPEITPEPAQEVTIQQCEMQVYPMLLTSSLGNEHLLEVVTIQNASLRVLQEEIVISYNGEPLPVSWVGFFVDREGKHISRWQIPVWFPFEHFDWENSARWSLGVTSGECPS